ncbi:MULTISPECIES: hypothetical protein [Streptomyces]|uniref:DUF1616 domain-containing protein n=1 Tax=Streptomyces lasiicapitis TaxID=1923961 RepID=A0ABQ2MTG4_9ACTN|nr:MULTISPECIES: hypothetical protein [Streptomyces]QIB46680.1 hypothetical protein G3H79_29990 [Streptomyces aureoverticillatus]GGO57723.1 hypothetical protein GCM10012286_75200 [Streptomyces lasiicapitis]
MQSISTKSASSGSGRPEQDPDRAPRAFAPADLTPLLAGVGVAAGCVGAAFALLDLTSPLRAPFVLFFLLAAPGFALSHWLRGLDGWSRAVACASGALVLDLLVAQAMLALHVWSIRGGVAAIAGVSALVFLSALARRLRHRAPSRRT